MNASKIEEGKIYEVKVGKNTTAMRVAKIEHRINGQIVFDCMNVKTNKRATVSDAKRFVREIKAKDETAKKSKTEKPVVETKLANEKLSGLNAAYKILVEEARPMKVKEITELAIQRGYCDLPGATPSATISSAIQREIKVKQEASRFVKIDKGMFAAR